MYFWGLNASLVIFFIVFFTMEPIFRINRRTRTARTTFLTIRLTRIRTLNLRLRQHSKEAIQSVPQIQGTEK
jgi:hypothetical protein